MCIFSILVEYRAHELRVRAVHHLRAIIFALPPRLALHCTPHAHAALSAKKKNSNQKRNAAKSNVAIKAKRIWRNLACGEIGDKRTG